MLFLLIFLALDAEITLKDPKATNTVDCLQPFKPLFSHGFRVKIFPSFECAGHIHSFENAPQALRPVVSAHCRLKIDQPRRSIRADKHIAKAAEIEMHKDSIKPGQKVVLVDDLIATGGTIEAAIKLVEQLGGEVVKILFLMELAGLKGREKLAKYDVASVITYEGK